MLYHDMTKAFILVVEDDETAAEMLRSVLTEEHYRVSVAGTAATAKKILCAETPDLLILDRGLPDRDGLDLCREIRTLPGPRALPVLFLTGKTSLTEKVLGLRMGGDDYLTKPFSTEELTARVEALLRRTQPSPEISGLIILGPIRMDVNNRTVLVENKEASLTNREFDLLKALLARPNRLLTRQFLLSNVWGCDAEPEITTKAVDMTVMGLRKKLGKYGNRIEAVTGFGYRYNDSD